MKFMSCECHVIEVEETKALLVNEGLVIFKVTMVEEDINLTKPFRREIVFYAPTPEIELMVKLKYPHGTFKDIMV